MNKPHKKAIYKKFQNFFGYDFLEDELDKILSNLVENLLVFGKAYIERVYWYDDEKNLKKITYQCINCRYLKMRNHNLKYKVKDENGRDVYSIEGRLFSFGKKLSVYEIDENSKFTIKDS